MTGKDSFIDGPRVAKIHDSGIDQGNRMEDRVYWGVPSGNVRQNMDSSATRMRFQDVSRRFTCKMI